MTDKPKIKGCLHTFDDGREVFVGHRVHGDETYFVRFKNKEGSNTFLKVSPEAFDMLIKMREACDRDGQPYWQLVNKADDLVSAV